MRVENEIPVNTLTYVDVRKGERIILEPPMGKRDSLNRTISNNKPIAILMAINFAVAAGLGVLAVKSCQEDSGQSTQMYSSQER